MFKLRISSNVTVFKYALFLKTDLTELLCEASYNDKHLTLTQSTNLENEPDKLLQTRDDAVGNIKNNLYYRPRQTEINFSPKAFKIEDLTEK